MKPLLHVPNSTESLAFNVDLSGAGLGTLCWYPISGNYGRLPRILFYCTISFAVLSSHFEFLIAGALVAALTYSGTTALHACLLVWTGPSYGEPDFYALLTILSTSCLIAVPLINWSSTLRNLGSHDGSGPGARMIIIYWAILVTIASVTCLGGMFAYTGPFPYNESITKTIACMPPTSTMNYAAAQSPYWPTPSPQFHIYKEWINDNGCMDPCAQGPFLWPPAIFRSLSDLQIVSHKEIQSLTQSAAQSEFYSFYLIAGSVVGCFVLAQGLWAICFGRKSPRQCRTVIYKFVNDAKMPRSKFHQRHRSVSRYGCILQKMSAKYLAIFAYLWTVISSIICVVLFVFNIIAMELLLSDLPQSESATHVGAWSPWAATGLIFAAALISKIPSNPIRKMFNSSCQAVRIICHWIRSGVIPVRDIISRPGIQNSGPLAPTESKTPGRVRTAKMHPLSALSKKFERNLASCRNTLTEEWESLVGFWRDPDCTETAMA